MAEDIFENDLFAAVHSIAEQSRSWVKWIDSQVDHLLSQCVRIDSASVTVYLTHQIKGLPDILLNELWIRIWSEMNWPRQQMSHDKWGSITRLATGQKISKINLPGNLTAESKEDQLTIWAASADYSK